MPKAPAGFPENQTNEIGVEFADAVNHAARKGYTVWLLREQWNGTWACSLSNPNSNAPSMGDSIGYVRQGPTPGAAIFAALSQFSANADEQAALAMEKEFNDGAILQAIVRLSPPVAKDFLRALKANLDARRL